MGVSREVAMRTSPQIDPSDEATLLERLRGGDLDAVRFLTRRFNRRLYRLARSIVRDDDAAEDIVQESYLRAITALPEFRGEASFGTWLTRIVINEALQHVRRRQPTLATRRGIAGNVVPFPPSSQADPERTMAQREIHNLLEQAIDHLPEPFRIVLVARILEGMSTEETASLLDLPPATVRSRLHRSRRLLRAEVEGRIGPLLLDAFPFAGRRCDRTTEAVVERIRASL
jgi:RNA polymerase sigma-70 factor, ECF subfamily